MKFQPTVILGDPMILCAGSSACQPEKLNRTISTPKPSSHDTHILAGLKAGLIWCQFPNQERVHVLPYQCLVKMKSNEGILKCRQRNRMKKKPIIQVAAKEIYFMICWTIQKIPVGETSSFYYLNVVSISMATR